MCIIVYKPANAGFPNEKVLEECFNANKDGAGYMYARKNSVHIRKGFETFKAFYSDLQKTRDLIGDDFSFVMHFRISTQGGVQKELTHPYPLCDSIEKMRKLYCKSDIAIAHNGIISLTSTYGNIQKLDYNDTMKFIQEYLSLIINNRDFYKNKNTLKLIEKLCKSKLAILDGSGHCELIGDFYLDDGCYYSNYSYRPISYYYKNNNTQYPYTQNYNLDDCYNDNYEYEDFHDKYDKSYDKKTNSYDFVEDFCPYSLDEDLSFCDFCKSKDSCSVYEDILDMEEYYKEPVLFKFFNHNICQYSVNHIGNEYEYVLGDENYKIVGSISSETQLTLEELIEEAKNFEKEKS